MVELVSPLLTGRDQPGLLQHRQMLRDGLPSQAQLMSARQANTDLEQGLTITLGQLIEDDPPSGVGKSRAAIAHTKTIGKSLLSCQ